MVAEAGDLSSAIRYVRGHAPHVLLLDLRMAGGSSIEVIRQMRAEAPETHTIRRNLIGGEQRADCERPPAPE